VDGNEASEMLSLLVRAVDTSSSIPVVDQIILALILISWKTTAAIRI
jgi:hypothetical protein